MKVQQTQTGLFETEQASLPKTAKMAGLLEIQDRLRKYEGLNGKLRVAESIATLERSSQNEGVVP
jgi:hypothetical protein